jgi:hypothetical protein
MKRILLFVLLLLMIKETNAQIQTAGSYLNITRPNGGPIQNGDIVEIRAVISVPSGTTVTAARFTDNVPTGTTYIANSIKTVTNEGVVVGAVTNTGSYTDATGDDRGQHVGGAITVYLGDGATASAGGTINGTTTLPRHYNAACILMIAYQVRIGVNNGSSVTFTGAFRYTTGSVQNITLPANELRVAPLGECTSPSGTNIMTAETNGTFGSGTAHSRSSSTNVTGFTYSSFSANNPVDGQYSITKNTSPTQYTGATPTSADRVFGVWDIFGDHSGTTTAAGNSPAPSGSNRGYMAIVNASYAPAAVFNVPISGLQTNTSYTLSFWLRNICGTCGNNPSNTSGSGTPGVKPNLAFEMDGVDLYSTGEVAYTGTWVQKTFTFYSGAGTSFTMSIKNNAPGGGGNDWAIDDIVVQQCFIVLPLKMESFTASRRFNDVVLNWETSDELNLSYFTVERSTDGINFHGIANISGGPALHHYQFTDHDNLSGKIYYRLKVVDRDDRSIFSKTLMIAGGPGRNEVTVMPNPVKAEAILNVQSVVKGLAVIRVFNTEGKLMLKQTSNLSDGSNQLILNDSHQLKNGIYLVQVMIGGSTFNATMVVSR